MRLSEWRKTAPTKESMSDRVLAVLRCVLVDLGSEPDPECWVAWGDDPESRYSVLASTVAGLVTVVVRPADPEGPRATAKLIRWSKVSVTELGVEASGGRRIVGVQVESFVLKGVDEEADRICEFVRGLIAGIENRGTAPVSFVQASALPTASIVALAPVTDLGDEPEPEPELEPEPEPELEPELEPAQVAADMEDAEPTPDASPNPAAIASAKVVPIGSKAASRPPARPAAPVAPTLIARRAVSIKAGDPAPAPKRPAPAAPVAPATDSAEPQPGQKAWIGPHPIEDPVPPPKPRPWMP
jgi:hypothetical protein